MKKRRNEARWCLEAEEVGGGGVRERERVVWGVWWRSLGAVSVAVVFAAGAWGCRQGSWEAAERVEVATTGRPIVNGTFDSSTAHQAVVALYNNYSNGLCSGTLISPNVVLTAAHCVSGGPTYVDVYVGTNTSGSGDWYDVVDGVVHPGYDAGSGTEPPRNDIALLQVQGSVSGVTPIPVLPPNQRLTSADVYPNPIDVVFVGFGQDEDGQSGVKLTITLPLEMLCFGPEDCFLVVGNSAGIMAPKTLGFAITTGGPCSGDSGGPALVNRGGTEYVAGVNSYGDEDCQAFNVGTLTDGFYAFIQNFLGNGPFEVCEGWDDEDGDGQVDCNDPDCDADTACMPGPWTTTGEICNPSTHPCSDGSTCLLLTQVPNWPEGAGVCSPTCTQPNATNGECHEDGNGLGLCALSWGTDNYCALYCGSSLGEGCPSGFTCRDFDTGAVNPQQGVCVPNQPPSEPDCDDGVDEDGDGLTDCDDPDCDAAGACNQPELCDNDVDDDGDGQIDCADPDCVSASVCDDQENCTNGVDDDGDGQADCDDPDCASAQVCSSSEICDNGVDDDGDGQIDCADPDCATAGVCNGDELCFNDIDDDGDGLVDCDDPECAGAEGCVLVEICNNGGDDDGDGYVDCADSDCAADVSCGSSVSDDNDGCGCRVVRGRSAPFEPRLLFLVLLGGLLWAGGRRRL